MSGTTTAPPAPAAEATPAPSAEAAPADDTALGEAGQKALKAERDARSQAEKSAKALQAQLDALQTAQMSDLEKANKAAQDAQAEALKATNEALRYKHAARVGMKDDDAELFLTGSDDATIAKQADRWAEVTAPTPPTTANPRVATDPSQGGGGAPPALNSDALEDTLKQKLGIT